MHPGQQHLELKHYQQLELTHVIVVGGMYTLIKHHKRMNEIFDRVHAYQLEPILAWDLWWIPSPHLRVTHVMSGSWWQYGLHGIELAKCQRRGLPPPDPSMKHIMQLKKKKHSLSSELESQVRSLQNYQFLKETLLKRSIKRSS